VFAIDIGVLSMASIVLLVVKVPVSSYFVTLLFGFSLSLVMSLLMLGIVRIVFHDPPVLFKQKNSALACGLIFPFAALLALTVNSTRLLPGAAGTADVTLLVVSCFVTALAGIWIVAMFFKSLHERAWTADWSA
jgi:hypothetical protein